MGRFRGLTATFTFTFHALSTMHVDALATAKEDSGFSANSNPLTEEFAKLVKQKMDLMNVPGLAIGVVDGEDVYTEGYGFSVLPDTAATADTLFYAGSTTKAQTAACLSALIQSGLYDELARNWSTPISSILKDDFVLPDQWATDHVTLDDAVSHRSGLPKHDISIMQEKHGAPTSLKDIVRNMRNLPMPFEARAKFIYTNYLYITLSYVIEKVTGKDLKWVMREIIWDPLGMEATYFGLEDAKQAPMQLASGYIWNSEAGKYSETTLMPGTDLSGAAAVISNVGDYAKWIKALINQTQIFPDAVHQDILTPRTVSSPHPFQNIDVQLYGLGWGRSTFKGRVVYFHDGSMIGFKSQVFWFPNESYGIVMFTNADRGDYLIQDLSWKLIGDKFSVPGEDLFNNTARCVEGVTTQEENVNERFLDFSAIARNRVSLKDLEGTYVHKGYGKLNIKIEAHTSDGNTLIANRPRMTWNYGLRFRHVFGDNWIACQYWLDEPHVEHDFFPAKFVKGYGRKPSALEMVALDHFEFEGDVRYVRHPQKIA